MDPSPVPQSPEFILHIRPVFRDLVHTRNRDPRYLPFSVSCEMSDHSGNIGIMEGHLVNRAFAEEAGFDRTMEEIDTECSFAMASKIFDKWGQLRKKWFLETCRGSGIWDARVNIGNFFIIDSLRVEEQYRRRGFATYLVSALLSSMRACNLDVSYVFTDVGEVKGEARMSAIAFWRAVGFKRIGLSHAFCFAMSMDDRSKMPDAGIDDAEKDVYDSEASFSTEPEFSSAEQSYEIESSPQSLASGELNEESDGSQLPPSDNDDASEHSNSSSPPIDESDESQLPPSDNDDASEHSNSPSPLINEEAILAGLFSPNDQSSHTSIEEENMSMEDPFKDYYSEDDEEDTEDLFRFSP